MCYHLAVGAWKELLPGTIQECFLLRAPSIGAVGHYVGESEAVQMVVEIIATAMALINVGKGIRKEQIYPTAALIVSMPEFRLFSVADFRLAINRGVTGAYGKMYDSFDVATISNWLREYWSERMEVAESAATIQHTQDGGRPTEMPQWFSDYLRESKARQIRVEAERRELETRADEYRKAWEDEIFETVMVSQWTKSVRVQVQELNDKTGETKAVWKTAEMLCNESDPEASVLDSVPIRNYKDGGVERLMKRAIFEYVAFCDAGKTNRLYAQLSDEVARRYESSDYMKAESKAILINISTLRREMPADKILENLLRQNPAFSEQQLAAELRYTMESWEAEYYDEYLPQCIERKYPALKLPEMLWADALAAWVKMGGNENPVSKLIFNQ